MWTKEITGRFIQAVEIQKVLYDVTLADYKNNVAQATARAVIGKQFSISMFTFYI